MEVEEKTGCVIIQSQHSLLVTPTHIRRSGQSLAKATDMIEDALVGLLGAQESKCQLLYELTESYSQV